MKLEKCFLFSSAATFFLFISFQLSMLILKIFKLEYMNIVNEKVRILFYFLIVILIAQLLIFLLHKIITRKKGVLSFKKSCIFVVTVILFVTSLIFWLELSPTFFERSEYIVEKDGVKMTAYVHSFLQVDVYYYEYENSIVRGNNLKIVEHYGKGGYDPFKRSEFPPLKSVTYYDDNGNIIDLKEFSNNK